jgi:divalent metal cation (Fe/Co/Zn/Cd) transporter
MLSSVLVGLSAGLILILGAAHLLYTFVGRRLVPRDSELQASMNNVSPNISDQTTMWRAWIGFNASHSMGAILFGLIYGYLAVFEVDLLFGSVFLLSVGIAMLGGYVVLARRYWFAAPLAGISVSLICFVSGVIVSRL